MFQLMRKMYEVTGPEGTLEVWENREWAEQRCEEARQAGISCEVRVVERWGEIRERTHYPGCWQGHLECAVVFVRELQEALSHVLSTHQTLVAEGRLHTPGGCMELATATRQAREALERMGG